MLPPNTSAHSSTAATGAPVPADNVNPPRPINPAPPPVSPPGPRPPARPSIRPLTAAPPVEGATGFRVPADELRQSAMTLAGAAAAARAGLPRWPPPRFGKAAVNAAVTGYLRRYDDTAHELIGGVQITAADLDGCAEDYTRTDQQVASELATLTPPPPVGDLRPLAPHTGPAAFLDPTSPPEADFAHPELRASIRAKLTDPSSPARSRPDTPPGPPPAPDLTPPPPPSTPAASTDHPSIPPPADHPDHPNLRASIRDRLADPSSPPTRR